ncbi:hypothetical protein KKH56_00265 [bacterium]|nr:hypothetical protein [bacterium]
MQISQVASNAVSGINKHFDQLAKATTDIANMASGGEDNLVENIVDSKEAEVGVKLGVKALNMANEMMGQVVDMLI